MVDKMAMKEHPQKKISTAMLSKDFQGWLILDWRDRSMRVVKKRPKKLSPYEVIVKVDITVNIPKSQPEMIAKGVVDIPSTQVREILIDQI